MKTCPDQHFVPDGAIYCPYCGHHFSHKDSSRLAVFFGIGLFIAAIIILLGSNSSTNGSNSQSIQATSTRRPTEIPTENSYLVDNVPTSTFYPPSPTATKTTVANSPNTLYFRTRDNHLNALDILSGKIQQVVVLSDIGYATFSWVNNSKILIWSHNSLLLVDPSTNNSKDITPDNFTLGYGSSDVSKDGKIAVQYDPYGSSPTISWVAIDDNGNPSYPKDYGVNLDYYRYMSCMRWNPSAITLALTVSKLDKNSNVGIPNLAILDAGPGSQPVIIQRGVHGCISWSPDGNYIAYGNGLPNYGLYEFAKGIYIIEVLSGSNTQLSSTDGYNPVWSSDGNIIAFLTENGIYLLDVKTKQEKQIYSGDVIDLLWGK
jgi:hypothetical protein